MKTEIKQKSEIYNGNLADPKKNGWDNNARPFRDATKYQDDKKVKVKTKKWKGRGKSESEKLNFWKLKLKEKTKKWNVQWQAGWSRETWLRQQCRAHSEMP